MPRNTLQQLGALSGGPGTGAGAPQSVPEAALPPELHALLAERRGLEDRMTSLTGGIGQGSDPAADRRYPVTPLGERRRLDAEWARRRSQASDTLRRTAGDVAGDAGPRMLHELTGPAERSGERAIHGPQERSGQRRTPVPGHDEFRRGRETLGEATRSLTDPDLDRLANDPRLRDFGRDVPELPNRELRSIDDRMQHVGDRLDILKGGSGDLGHLRDVAMERLGARRREQQRDERRDAHRLDRQYSADDDRDRSRLDRREVR